MTESSVLACLEPVPSGATNGRPPRRDAYAFARAGVAVTARPRCGMQNVRRQVGSLHPGSASAGHSPPQRPAAFTEFDVLTAPATSNARAPILADLPRAAQEL